MAASRRTKQDDITHRGSCHCGNVTFSFQAPAALPVTQCNCSVCARTGFEHIIIAQSDMVITGADRLTLYKFGTGEAKHLFCRICGVKSFYIPRSHPDHYSVNLRCIDSGTLSASQHIAFDGQNWDKNIAELKNKV